MSKINIREITSQTRFYNFHTHTQYCDGRATIEEMTRAAVAEDFKYLGFTPHSPIPVESPCNMSIDAVMDYTAEIERVRKAFPGIGIYKSMEVDYLGPEWGPSNELVKTWDLDYVLGSVHFVPTQEGKPVDIDGNPERFVRNLRALFHDDLRYVVDKFYDQTLSMIEEGGLDIIAHLDKIAANASIVDPDIESYSWYKAHVEKVIDAVSQQGLIVEINTKAYAKTGRMFPAVTWWPKIIDKGLDVIVNSDAHYPDLIKSGRDRAFEILSDMINR